MLGQRYLEQHWGQDKLDKSGFCRRLHALADTLAALFAVFGQALKQLPTEARYVIDSFPVAVCHNTRIPRCKLLQDKAYHGRCASKRSWFYGFKVQVIATTDGVPVEYYVHASPIPSTKPVYTPQLGLGKIGSNFSSVAWVRCQVETGRVAG